MCSAFLADEERDTKKESETNKMGKIDDTE